MTYTQYKTFLKNDLKEWEYKTFFDTALSQLTGLKLDIRREIRLSDDYNLRNELVEIYLANMQYLNN